MTWEVNWYNLVQWGAATVYVAVMLASFFGAIEFWPVGIAIWAIAISIELGVWIGVFLIAPARTQDERKTKAT